MLSILYYYVTGKRRKSMKIKTVLLQIVSVVLMRGRRRKEPKMTTAEKLTFLKTKCKVGWCKMNH